MEFMVSILAILLIFVFCIGILAQRSDFNNDSFQKWSGQSVVSAFARNINNVSLMDNNSTVCDYIYWNEPNQTLNLNGRTVSVFMDDTYADSSLTSSNVIWNITDINGLICFSKKNNFVMVEYHN